MVLGPLGGFGVDFVVRLAVGLAIERMLMALGAWVIEAYWRGDKCCEEREAGWFS